ncbi:MAG: Tetratricopeptide 2 repeat protein [Planctomycetaceae bacterium]|nr:Tetratricopeptide 2 repeat protein [Planctomycetaceae bacterium]
MAVTAEFTSLFGQAKQHLKHREFDQAIDLFQQARQIDDDQPEMHEALAATYVMAGNLDLAIEHLVLVTRLSPRRTTAFVNLGALYNRQENYQKAIEMCRKAISIDRKSADGYYNLGIAHRKLKQMALAVPAYREAIRLNPQMAVAYQNLGNVFTDMGNFREAIVHFKQALVIDPNFEKAQVGLERAEQLKEASKTAVNPFGRLVDMEKEQSLSLDPSHFRTLTDEERQIDRQTLHIAILTIGRKAKDLRDQLKSKLAPELIQLEHNLSSKSDFDAILNQFKPISNLFQNASKMLESATRELRDHEQRLRVKP